LSGNVGAGVGDSDEFSEKNTAMLFDLTIWDCSGQDRYSGLTQKMLQFAHIVVLFYDVTSQESIVTMKQWWTEHLCTKKTLVCSIVGSKSDEKKRQVTYEEIADYSKKEYANFFGEISAKSGGNVSELCYHVCDLYYKTFV